MLFNGLITVLADPVQANATSSYESTSSSVEVTSGTTRATVREEYQSKYCFAVYVNKFLFESLN